MAYAREKGSSAETSDQALIGAARRGDLAAFSELFMRFEPSVRGYLTALCGDPELAADVAQETFIDLSHKLNQLRNDEAFAAWLYRSAHHRLRTETRRSWYRRVVSLNWLSDDRENHSLLIDTRDIGADAPERTEIQAALNALAPRLREALLLSRYAGFSCPEVARILGISSAAAKKRITRACTEFRLHYDQDQS